MSCHEISKSWGYNAQHGNYRSQYRIVLKVVKRIDLKSSHPKKKRKVCNCVWRGLLTYGGDHFAVSTYTKSLCCTPRTNTM